MARYSRIIGWGMHAPERVITNDDLAKIVETSDSWIRTRTGIRERRIVSTPQETTATLATRAARAALAMARIPPSALDLIIVATSSPEHLFPATACLVQDGLGAVNAGAYDLSAACSGFVYGIAMAHGMIVSGQADTIMIIGAETLSRLVDWSDRNTCVLFGDGAGAIILQGSNQPGGVLASVLGSDGSGADLLTLPAGGSRLPASLETVTNGAHYIKMDGKAVFRFATRVMAEATRQVVERAGLTLDDIDLIIPHQANVRIIESSVVRQLKFPREKVFMNLDRYGNTSTASIPIALTEAVAQGRVKPGDNVVFVGFGAGLTWAAAVVQWGVPLPTAPRSRWQRLQSRVWYPLARARSTYRRARRRFYAWISEPPEVSSEHLRRLRREQGNGMVSAATGVTERQHEDEEP